MGQTGWLACAKASRISPAVSQLTDLSEVVDETDELVINDVVAAVERPHEIRPDPVDLALELSSPWGVADVLLDWVRGEDLTLALEGLRDAFRRGKKLRDESPYTPPSRQLLPLGPPPSPGPLTPPPAIRRPVTS